MARSTGLSFEPLQAEHLDAVLEIERRSFPIPWTRTMFEREIALPISHFFVVREQGTVIGYGGYWQVVDEAHIINLAVHPDARGRGTGRLMLRYLLDAISAHGMRRVLLEVREGNASARRLYESEGFAVTGLRPDYYESENAVLMEKTI